MVMLISTCYICTKGTDQSGSLFPSRLKGTLPLASSTLFRLPPAQSFSVTFRGIFFSFPHFQHSVLRDCSHVLTFSSFIHSPRLFDQFCGFKYVKYVIVCIYIHIYIYRYAYTHTYICLYILYIDNM